MSSSAPRMLSTLSKALRTRRSGDADVRVDVGRLERGEEQLGGAQRLQEVVAGGGDEARLRGVGALGLGERVLERQRALVDALLEALVRRLERALGLALGGDVGEADRRSRGRASPGRRGRGAARVRVRERQRQRRPAGVARDPGEQPLGAGAVLEHQTAGAGGRRSAAKPVPTRRSCIGGASSVAEPGVPADEPAAGVEDADALVDVVEGGADQPRLLVEQLVALLPLELDQLGDVGLQDRGAAARRALLADLHPAVAGGLHVEVSPTAGGGGAAARASTRRGRGPSGSARCGLAAASADVLDEAQAGARAAAATSGSASQKRLLHITSRSSLSKSAKPSRTASIASVEVGARAASASVIARLRPGVRAVEQVERALEVAGAGAHLLLEHQRPLEVRVGRAAVVGRLLDARASAPRTILQELGVLPLDRIGGVDQRQASRQRLAPADRSRRR